MANNISDYLETALLNHVFRNIAYTSPTVVYAGLVSSVGSDAQLEAGTLTNEITTYTGTRKAITFGAPSQVSDKATIKNSAALTFDNMPLITVKYVIVCDSATKGAGNILYWCPLTVQKACNLGDTFQVAIDNLILDLA